MLEEGLSYPGWGDRWIGRFVIGSTLWLFGFLLIPTIALYGYGMRAMGQTARGEDVPPQWSDWTGLVIEGLRAMVVSFIYALIPNIIGAIVLFVAFTLLGGGAILGGRPGGGLALRGGAAVLVVGILVVLVVQLIVFYLLPAALINVNAENSLGAAFDVGAVTDIALSGSYLAALVHVAFIWVVTSIVGSVASVTGILLPPVLFWGLLASARVLGLSYRGALDEGPTDATPTPAAAAAGGAAAGAGAAGAAGGGARDEDVSFSEGGDEEPDPFSTPGPATETDAAAGNGADGEEFGGTDEGFDDENDDEF